MSKTFLKILAEEMPLWPRSAISIWQQMDGVVFYEDVTGRVWELGLYSTADGGFGESVTRAKWEAERERILEKSSRFTEEDKANLERARIAANQQATQEARDIARTGSMTSEEQELADIACGKRSKEDQELFDKVAFDFLKKNSSPGASKSMIKHASEYAWLYAEAFMAERAKRMKG